MVFTGEGQSASAGPLGLTKNVNAEAGTWPQRDLCFCIAVNDKVAAVMQKRVSGRVVFRLGRGGEVWPRRSPRRRKRRCRTRRSSKPAPSLSGQMFRMSRRTAGRSGSSFDLKSSTPTNGRASTPRSPAAKGADAGVGRGAQRRTVRSALGLYPLQGGRLENTLFRHRRAVVLGNQPLAVDLDQREGHAERNHRAVLEREIGEARTEQTLVRPRWPAGCRS